MASRIKLLASSHLLHHSLVIVLPPVIPLLRAKFGLSYWYCGLILSGFSLLIGLGGIPAGILADRFGKSKFLALSFIGIACICPIFLIARDITVFISLFFLLAALSAFYHPAGLALVSRMKKLGKSFGLHGIGGNIGMVIGPAVVGLVAWNWRIAFAIWTPIVLLIGISWFQRKEGKVDGKKGLRKLKNILLVYVCFGFVIGGVMGYLPLFLTDLHGFSPPNAAYFTAFFTLLGGSGKFFTGILSDRYGEIFTLSGSFLIASFLLFLIPIFTEFCLLILAILGFFLFGELIPIQALIGKYTCKAVAFGTFAAAGFGGGALARFIAGFIAQLLGLNFIFWIFAAISAVGAALSIRLK